MPVFTYLLLDLLGLQKQVTLYGGKAVLTMRAALSSFLFIFMERCSMDFLFGSMQRPVAMARHPFSVSSQLRHSVASAIFYSSNTAF